MKQLIDSTFLASISSQAELASHFAIYEGWYFEELSPTNIYNDYVSSLIPDRKITSPTYIKVSSQDGDEIIFRGSEDKKTWTAETEMTSECKLSSAKLQLSNVRVPSGAVDLFSLLAYMGNCLKDPLVHEFSDFLSMRLSSEFAVKHSDTLFKLSQFGMQIFTRPNSCGEYRPSSNIDDVLRALNDPTFMMFDLNLVVPKNAVSDCVQTLIEATIELKTDIHEERPKEDSYSYYANDNELKSALLKIFTALVIKEDLQNQALLARILTTVNSTHLASLFIEYDYTIDHYPIVLFHNYLQFCFDINKILMRAKGNYSDQVLQELLKNLLPLKCYVEESNVNFTTFIQTLFPASVEDIELVIATHQFSLEEQPIPAPKPVVRKAVAEEEEEEVAEAPRNTVKRTPFQRNTLWKENPNAGNEEEEEEEPDAKHRRR